MENITIRKIDDQTWVNDFAEDSHLVVFGEFRPKSLNRIDFALLILDFEGKASGYATCRELDKETLYWQYGGAFPNYKGSIYTVQGFHKLVEWCSAHYQRVTTKVENTNITWLKFLFKGGFIPVGMHVFEGRTYIELMVEFKKG